MRPSHRFELSAPDRAVVIVLAAAFGVMLAVAVPTLLGFVAEHDLPLPGWLRSLARLDAEWLWWGRPVIGLLLGAGAGLLVIDQSWSLEITSERVVAKRGNDVRRIPADRVGIVYRTGRRTVVIEGRDGAELFKGTVEGDRGTVPVAFAQQGYPWDEV